MYQTILLAYDGSREGRMALREGAILAKQCAAKVYLLAVVPHVDPEGAHSITAEYQHYRDVLDEGVQRLTALGMAPVAKLAAGDASRAIGAYAEEVGADLVVVAHQRRSLLERWWSGPLGGYISDNIRCSLLVARDDISDAVFAEKMAVTDLQR
jgi:nucleotide-binding universal stress UspA family protein